MRWLSAFFACCLMLAACGGAASTEGTGANIDADSPSSDGADTSQGSDESQGSDGEADTFAEIFGYSDDPEASEAQYREQERQIQESIRLCMAEQGFEYIPVEQPAGSFDGFGPEDQEDWVREQGFGISTWYGNEDQSGPTEEDIPEDPNQPIVDAMSESERDAYYGALWGTPEEQAELEDTVVDDSTGEEYSTMTGFGPGCYGVAQEEVYGSFAEDEALFAQLEPIYEELQTRMEADPRMIEANQTWSKCMADAGYDYDTPESFYEFVYEDFQRRFEDIVGPNGGYPDPFAGWSDAEIEAFFEEKSEEEQAAFFEAAENQSSQDIDEEALAALQKEEIDLAVAEFECSKPLQDLYLEVSEKYEAEVIAENRDLFEQVRESTQN